MAQEPWGKEVYIIYMFFWNNPELYLWYWRGASELSKWGNLDLLKVLNRVAVGKNLEFLRHLYVWYSFLEKYLKYIYTALFTLEGTSVGDCGRGGCGCGCWGCSDCRTRTSPRPRHRTLWVKSPRVLARNEKAAVVNVAQGPNPGPEITVLVVDTDLATLRPTGDVRDGHSYLVSHIVIFVIHLAIKTITFAQFC